MALPRNPDRGLYSQTNAAGKVRWYVRASVNGRMQHFGSFDTKTKARLYYDRIKLRRLEQRLNPGRVMQTELTVPELFGAYLPQAAHRAAYREQVRFSTWWRAYWPHQPVFDLTPADLEQARIALRTSGRSGARSEGTVNHHLKCLRHAMRAVVQPRSWVIDLWSQVKLDRPKGVPPTPMSPQDEQLIRAQMTPDDAAKVRLGVLTGLRRSQLFGMRWEQALWSVKALAVPTIKGQRARFIPLPQEALRILKARWTKAGQPGTGYVFPHADTSDLPEDPAAWYKYRFRPAVKRAGLAGKGLKFHSTRHAFAVRFLEAGGHVRQLQQAGGWSSLDQVEIYTQVQDEDMRQAMNQAAKLGTNRRKLQKSKRPTTAKDRKSLK